MMQSIVFLLVLGVAFWLAGKKFMAIRRNILLGKDEPDTVDNGLRWKNVFLVAFGQKKMFKRWIPAVLHGFIYVAFLFTQIELIEIIVDGVFNQHRFFRPFLGGFYTFLISIIEVLSLGALIATFIFLARRNLLKIPRFHKSEMDGWPKLDGNIILYLEIVLVFCVFMMNGADEVLYNGGHSHANGIAEGAVGSFNFAITEHLGPMLFGGMSTGTLEIVERIGWWGHILVVLAFLNYLPISKHLHIMLAFPNVYHAKISSRGQMQNMPEIMNEVKSMMDPDAAFADDGGADEELPDFGSKDVFDIGWKDILGAYSCTECGRCTSVCPANLTGKKLSPRKIMMDIRDRAEEVGANLDSGKTEFIAEDKRAEASELTAENYDDGKSLFDYITKEELHACTTCNACVEACPIMINPLEPILKLRRYEILTESAGPSEWVPMFTSIENSGSIWAVSDARDKWTQLIKDENEAS